MRKFCEQGGVTICEAPNTRNFITDDYMRMVNADPKLRECANRSN